MIKIHERADVVHLPFRDLLRIVSRPRSRGYYLEISRGARRFQSCTSSSSDSACARRSEFIALNFSFRSRREKERYRVY